MSLDQWMLYLGMTILVSLSPGPVMLMCLANGARKTRRQVLLGMAGASTGNVFLMVLSALGLGALVYLWPQAFAVIGVAGALYLFYMGWQIWRGADKPTDQFTSLEHNSWLSGFYIAASNPKGILYFGALFPQFIQPQQGLVPQLATLTVSFLLIDLVAMEMYAYGGKWFHHRLNSPATLRGFNRMLASFLMLAGIGMAIQQLV